jgi:hypothetical protein
VTTRSAILAIGLLIASTCETPAQTPIDQTLALKGGITPGHSPGFPITISVSGSYRLVGNLSVDPPSSAIVIAADNVTIDLNGFTIAPLRAGSAKSFDAITDQGASRTGIVVRDGVISDFGTGIQLYASQQVTIAGLRASRMDSIGINVGTSSTVSGNHSYLNRHGIITGAQAIVSRNVVYGNAGDGILTLQAAIIEGNSSSRNSFNGIVCSGGACSINSNSVYFNQRDGISAQTGSLIKNNSASDSGWAGIRCEANCSILGNVTSRNQFGIFTYCPGVLVENAASNNTADFALAGGGSTCTLSNNYPPP